MAAMVTRRRYQSRFQHIEGSFPPHSDSFAGLLPSLTSGSRAIRSSDVGAWQHSDTCFQPCVNFDKWHTCTIYGPTPDPKRISARRLRYQHRVRPETRIGFSRRTSRYGYGPILSVSNRGVVEKISPKNKNQKVKVVKTVQNTF